MPDPASSNISVKPADPQVEIKKEVLVSNDAYGLVIALRDLAEAITILKDEIYYLRTRRA